ncbi:nitrile hydratase accessory protein [Marivita sp. S6314]|uniref:nitrile hydratase accessory protein n=1 Tax=Marivita sp. S6314 TaxID=2926406 RepID=UPI001FF4C9D5|nr:nitrile hydratase accessory protein [Marivita sp. S6314]MCK0149492.1 nitrile hydratase accessory protein [Marivita sp. S6314]
MTTPDAPFEEPWQAQLFALTVALNEAGHFTWVEWSEVFGPMVQTQGADVYWHIWSDALTILLETKGMAEGAVIRSVTAQWQEAARNTPHGQPILLSAANPLTP